MKQAVIIGAGSIGRGFLGQILTEGGYAVTFLDVNSELVEQLNRRGSYPLEIVSTNRIERRFIGPVCAVNGNDREASARAIADCDLCVTCVGAKAIPYIIPNLAAGVKLRFADGGTALNLLICENLMDADVYIRSLLETHLTVEELDTVGLVETSVGRMVPLPDKNAADPLLVRAEAYPVLPYDRDACIGELPKAQGLIPVSPFRYVIERKLYIHNMGHAVCAYLGMRRGYATIADAIDDPEIRLTVREAMTESAFALSKHYGKPLDELILHTEDLIRRFGNHALGDTCARVGNDIPRKLAKSDRLTGASLAVLGAGGHPAYIAIGAAAALYALHPENPALSFSALSQVTEGEYYRDTLGFYGMMRENAPLSEMRKRADELLSARVGVVV